MLLIATFVTAVKSMSLVTTLGTFGKVHFIQTVMVIDTPKPGNLALNLTHEFRRC